MLFSFLCIWYEHTWNTFNSVWMGYSFLLCLRHHDIVFFFWTYWWWRGFIPVSRGAFTDFNPCQKKTFNINQDNQVIYLYTMYIHHIYNIIVYTHNVYQIIVQIYLIFLDMSCHFISWNLRQCGNESMPSASARGASLQASIYTLYQWKEVEGTALFNQVPTWL